MLSLIASSVQAEEKVGDMLRALKNLNSNLSGFEYSIQKITEEKAKTFCDLIKTEPSFNCQLQTDEAIKGKQNITATIVLKAQNGKDKLIEIADKIQAFTTKEKLGFTFSVKFTAKSSN